MSDMDLKKYREVLGEEFTKDTEFIDSQIKAMKLNKDSKILDIGTGWGAMAILLALNGLHVLTGQPEEDPEWDGHMEGGHEHEGHEHHFDFPDFDWRKNAANLGVEDMIEFQNLDAQKLHFEDGSFDGVFLFDALQHMEDRVSAINESVRVISGNGLVCIIEWNQKTIEDEKENYGHEIDYVDPREFLSRDDIEIELVEGEYVNIFLIRKA
jgi:tRNA A58 N-methylase Trm61